MFLYEVSVDPDHRNRGIGRTLVRALADVARQRGCYGMWVATEPDNAAALAAYRAAAANPPEPFLPLSWTFDDEDSVTPARARPIAQRSCAPAITR